MAKIVLLLHFLWSPVWWLYIQSVCWCCRYAGPVCTLGQHIILYMVWCCW